MARVHFSYSIRDYDNSLWIAGELLGWRAARRIEDLPSHRGLRDVLFRHHAEIECLEAEIAAELLAHALPPFVTPTAANHNI